MAHPIPQVTLLLHLEDESIMACDFFTWANWLFGFFLGVMGTLVGGMAVWRPVRLWYWLEWLDWKQAQWWLGYRPDQLESPEEQVRNALALYPKAVRIIQFVGACMLLVGLLLYFALTIFLIQLLKACF